MLTNTLEAAIAVRSPAAEPVVTVRGLRKAYDGREVVRGIDFEIHRGEVVAVLGPNGAGKTTTVEILEGFRRADAGEVRVLGADPASAGPAWRERLGVVLQESRPEQGLSVRDCLRRYAGYYAHPRDVDETLERVGLGDRADVRAQALSGGQQRRLDVALALIGDPELLFLDEPTTGFDPSARRAAWELVDSLRADGTTILLTTHYMEEAERLADRIVVLRDGEIAGAGTPRTLGGRDRAQSEIVFALPSGLAPGDLPVELAVRTHMAQGGRFSLPSPDAAADLYALAGWAVAQGVPLAELEVRRPSLEDVYLELTPMTLLAHEVRWDLIAMFRNKRARFFTLAFPLLLLVILVGISRGGTVTVGGEETSMRQFFVGGIVAMSLLSACYAALVGTVVSEREYGVLKRRRATPVAAWIVVAAQAIATLVVAAISTVILLVVARVLYGVATPAGGLAIVGLAVVAGGLAFSCVAYAMATLIPNVDAAQPAVQLTILPLYFVSGIWFSTDDLPDALQTIAHLLPVEPLAHVLHLAFLDATVDAGDLAVLAVWAVIGLAVAVRRFSWLPRDVAAA